MYARIQHLLTIHNNYNCKDKIWNPGPHCMESWIKKPNAMNFVEYGSKN